MSNYVLAIDTALSACSVAITRGEETLAAHIEPMARGQAERLALLVAQVMGDTGIGFNQLDIIAVTRGPGAFTGLRVGLAFARGLALSLNRPCIGISTLEILAKGAGQQKTIAAIDVAGSVFVGAWDGATEVIAPCRPDLQAVLDTLDGEWTITGPGLEAIQRLRPDWTGVAQNLPNPAILAHIARSVDPTTHAPTPLYLRGIDAKLPGGISLPENVP